MTKGTKVKWTTKDGLPGWGIVLDDEHEGKVIVEVHQLKGEDLDYHPLIICTTTWLTVIP